jgi:hypothetical protein
MINVVTRPVKEFCNYNAVGNPVVYLLRREDYQFNQINDDGGYAQIQINGIDLTAFFEVDDSVYVELVGLFTITGIVFSGGNTLVTIDLAYTGSATGFINNISKRTDYFMEVEIFDAITNESLGPKLSISPTPDGECKCDISGIVKAYLYADWSAPAGQNEVEENTSKKVYIQYNEFYDDTFWVETSDEADPVVCVFAVTHLLMNPPPNYSRYAHGGNLLSYFPDDDSRLWMTRFNPSHWRGWPFTLSFMWPEGFSGSNGGIERRVKQINSEGTDISEAVTSLTPDDNLDTVHRMKLGAIDADAAELEVTLEMGTSGDADAITETLIVKVKDPCDNPILLFWKNNLGGDAFWMFEESQDYQFIYDSGRVVKRLTLFADNLTPTEWDGINQLNSVSQVIARNIVDYGMDDSIDKTHFRNDNQVYIINEDGSKTGVIVIATGNKTKTSQKKHFIELTIELPELFTV